RTVAGSGRGRDCGTLVARERRSPARLALARSEGGSRMRRVASAAFCAVAIAAMLTGCGSDAMVVSASAGPASVAAALEAARGDSEADPVQIEVLEIALEAERYPSDTEYRIAYEIALQCMRDSGSAQARASEELIRGAQETIKCEFLPA